MKINRIACLTVICVLLLSCFATNSNAEEGYRFSYEDSTGWAVFAMKPANQVRRVNSFETKFSECEKCREEAYALGNYKLFKEMRKVDYDNWWSALIYIPSEHFMPINKNSKFTMVGINKQGSVVEIDSEAIVFCKGWVRHINGFQHTVFDNRECSYQVKYASHPGLHDFESNLRGGYYYLVAYIYFGKHQKLREITSFLPTGIKSYPINPTISGRRDKP